MSSLQTIASFLDRELDVADWPDASHNGVQVENSGRVRRVCCGVDASMDFFEQAARRRADLLVCHHGLSWGDSLKRITGLNYRRLKFLLEHDMALYACHLPLDAHPRLGNNAGIAKGLSLQKRKPFGLYNGREIGIRGELPRRTAFATLVKRVQALLGQAVAVMDFGKTTVRTVGVISGGAADEIAEAAALGLDVYISGEPKLTAYHLAREHGIHAIFGGHYATEVFGVRALADLLARRCAVQAEFIDMNVPY